MTGRDWDWSRQIDRYIDALSFLASLAFLPFSQAKTVETEQKDLLIIGLMMMKNFTEA